MAKKIKKLINKLILFLPFLIVFLGSLYPPSDSDLGWHLKYGEYFFQHHQILRENTFSYLMADYHWVNSSWATDLLSYVIFHNFGFLGLTILGALVITLIFYFFAKAAKLTLWEQTLLFPLLLYFESPVNSISFRGQLLTFLFLGILFYLIGSYEEGKANNIFMVIPLYLFWVNFHGEFLLGIGVFFLWIFIYLVEKFYSSGRRITPDFLFSGKYLIFVFIVSVFATLINPFGFGVYLEASRHFFNPWQKYIAEWLPFDQLSTLWWNHIVMGILIMGGFISLFFTEKLKQKIPYLVITLLFFALSFMMRRYGWPLYYIALPLIKPLADLFKPPDKKITYGISVILLITSMSLIIGIKSPFDQYTTMTWAKFCSDFRSCSPKAAEFLIKNRLNVNNGKLLTLYDWGGWLIWNYPQIRPTIDGRMHLWRDDKGYSAFAEYYPIEQNWEGHDIDKSQYDIAFMSPSKTVYNHLINLVNKGKWKLVYQDKFAGIFIRSNVYGGYFNK